MGDFVADNWMGIVESMSFLLAALAFRSQAKTHQIANFLTITTNHRQIWKEYYSRPELAAVLEPDRDLLTHPAAPAEEEWAKAVIHHLATVYYARMDSLLPRLDEIRKDVNGFLSLPVPLATWEKIKPFQNKDFVRFVEECRSRR